jgi:hypothetical protein
MSDISRIQLSGPTRRTILLRGVACAAGAAALFETVPHANAGKMAQTAAAYQDSPKGTQECSNCILFQAPGSCQVVDGAISPSGWCKFWAKKPS